MELDRENPIYDASLPIRVQVSCGAALLERVVLASVRLLNGSTVRAAWWECVARWLRSETARP